MINENPSKLNEAIKHVMSPQSSATADMKYGMIANLGMVGLSEAERAKMHVTEPSIEHTAGVIKYVESGLSDNDFAVHVADALQRHIYNGDAADLQKVTDGVFSVRLSDTAIVDLNNSMPPERTVFVALQNPDTMHHMISGFSKYINTPNMVHSRPYLDS